MCFTKYPTVDPEPTTYTKLVLALYTGIKEKIANMATIAQMVLSPLICLKMVLNYSFLSFLPFVSAQDKLAGIFLFLISHLLWIPHLVRNDIINF